MNAHELARLLLAGPDIQVEIHVFERSADGNIDCVTPSHGVFRSERVRFGDESTLQFRLIVRPDGKKPW